MINFIDFVPNITKRFLVSNDVESLAYPLERANQWIRQNEMFEIINIETLVLPNIHNEDGSGDAELWTAGESGAYWYQVIRVWYRC